MATCGAFAPLATRAMLSAATYFCTHWKISFVYTWHLNTQLLLNCALIFKLFFIHWLIVFKPLCDGGLLLIRITVTWFHNS